MNKLSDLSDFINQLDDVAIMFYQQKTTEAYKKFAQIINLLAEIVTELFELKNVNKMLQFNENILLDRFETAVKALEAKDDILLADILYYDFIPQFQRIEEYLEN